MRTVRQMIELSFEELLDRLEIPADTLILFHRNPDADAVGSAFALKEILESLGSRAWCVCGDEIPQRLRFLTFDQQSSVLPVAIPEDFAPTRVISVDTASPAQMGTLWETCGDKVDLMIDHHATGEAYADFYIASQAAATGEIMFDVVKHFATEGLMTITDSICTCLYAAISADTGGFQYSNVTPETHQRAAELVASGIDCADINHRLFSSNSLKQLRAQAAGISNLNVFADGKIAVVTFPYALKAALGLDDEHLDNLVEIARSLAGVRVAIAIKQPGTDGIFRVSMRSQGSYDVAALCATFGGGGHQKAAGCTLTAADVNEAMQKIISAIDFIDLD